MIAASLHRKRKNVMETTTAIHALTFHNSHPT